MFQGSFAVISLGFNTPIGAAALRWRSLNQQRVRKTKIACLRSRKSTMTKGSTRLLQQLARLPTWILLPKPRFCYSNISRSLSKLVCPFADAAPCSQPIFLLKIRQMRKVGNFSAVPIWLVKSTARPIKYTNKLGRPQSYLPLGCLSNQPML